MNYTQCCQLINLVNCETLLLLNLNMYTLKKIIFILENGNWFKFTKLIRKSTKKKKKKIKTGNTEYVCERGENEGRDTIVKMANFCRTIFVYCNNQRFKFQTCCFCMLIFEQKKRKCNTVLKSKDFLVFFFFSIQKIEIFQELLILPDYKARLEWKWII